MRILWVEDEPKDSEAWIKVVSEELGQDDSIAFAGAVDEAVRMMNTEAYDLFILDLNIPLGPDAQKTGSIATSMANMSSSTFEAQDDCRRFAWFA